jgi:2-keto-3-deoxy-6-phosphogluconate aldolase
MANKNLNALVLTGATATTNGPDMDNNGSAGGHFVINIGTITGTAPTATFTIQGKDPLSGQYYTILASTALNATGATVLKVFPGLTAAANSVASDIIPPTWRVIMTAGGTVTNLTATVAANLVD